MASDKYSNSQPSNPNDQSNPSNCLKQCLLSLDKEAREEAKDFILSPIAQMELKLAHKRAALKRLELPSQNKNFHRILFLRHNHQPNPYQKDFKIQAQLELELDPDLKLPSKNYANYNFPEKDEEIIEAYGCNRKSNNGEEKTLLGYWLRSEIQNILKRDEPTF